MVNYFRNRQFPCCHKILIKALCLAAFTLILFNSTSVFAQDKSAEIVDISNALDKYEKLNLSEIISDVSFVKLETNKNCLINKIYAVIRVDDKIVIFDKDNQDQFGDKPTNLLVFSDKGKFLNPIGTKGNGPGEYAHINDICVDKEEGFLFLLSSSGFLLQYDLQGNHIKSTKLPFTVFDISIFHGELLFHFSPYNNSSNNDYLFAKSDYNLSNIVRYRKSEPSSMAVHKYKFYKFEDHHRYWYNLIGDTVYKINREFELSPLFYMEYPDKRSLKSRSNVGSLSIEDTFINHFLETKDYLFFAVTYQRMLQRVLYNKTNGKSIGLRYSKGITNDMFWYGGYYPWSKVADNIMYSTHDIIDLKEQQEKGQSETMTFKLPNRKKELENLVNQSTEDDNPIIVFITLK